MFGSPNHRKHVRHREEEESTNTPEIDFSSKFGSSPPKARSRKFFDLRFDEEERRKSIAKQQQFKRDLDEQIHQKKISKQRANNINSGGESQNLRKKLSLNLFEQNSHLKETNSKHHKHESLASTSSFLPVIHSHRTTKNHNTLSINGLSNQDNYQVFSLKDKETPFENKKSNNFSHPYDFEKQNNYNELRMSDFVKMSSMKRKERMFRNKGSDNSLKPNSDLLISKRSVSPVSHNYFIKKSNNRKSRTKREIDMESTTTTLNLDSPSSDSVESDLEEMLLSFSSSFVIPKFTILKENDRLSLSSFPSRNLKGKGTFNNKNSNSIKENNKDNISFYSSYREEPYNEKTRDLNLSNFSSSVTLNRTFRSLPKLPSNSVFLSPDSLTFPFSYGNSYSSIEASIVCEGGDSYPIRPTSSVHLNPLSRMSTPLHIDANEKNSFMQTKNRNSNTPYLLSKGAELNNSLNLLRGTYRSRSFEKDDMILERFLVGNKR